jgi:hypothetical protein
MESYFLPNEYHDYARASTGLIVNFDEQRSGERRVQAHSTPPFALVAGRIGVQTLVNAH